MAAFIVRGALLNKRADSSFAEAHREFLSEPTHTEDEVKDQENELEDERDSEECKVRVEEKSDTQAHDTWITWRVTLEQMSRATLLNMRANTRKCDV